MSETLHMSSVAIGGHGVLIEGASGAGKSDLALRLIDRGAVLVSDDYTVLSAEAGVLVARPPATIAGRIEVRGIGIVAMPHLDEAPVALLVRLSRTVERLPLDVDTQCIADVVVAAVTLDPRAASAPIAVELALKGSRSSWHSRNGSADA